MQWPGIVPLLSLCWKELSQKSQQGQHLRDTICHHLGTGDPIFGIMLCCPALKIHITFEQGSPHCYCALDPAIYGADPESINMVGPSTVGISASMSPKQVHWMVAKQGQWGCLCSSEDSPGLC